MKDFTNEVDDYLGRLNQVIRKADREKINEFVEEAGKVKAVDRITAF